MGDTTVSVNVLVDEGYWVDHPELVATLRDAGMRVDRVLPSVGVVVGQLASGDIDRVRQVPGVLEIEPTRTLRAT